MMRNILFVVFSVFFFLNSASAESSFTTEMETDRPDFTEGTQSVETGHLQVELGYTYTRNKDAGVQTEEHTVPEALLRVGVLDETELRLAWTGYINRNESSSVTPDSRADGFSDLSVGFKHTFGEQKGLVPALGIIFEVNLPVGKREFRSDAIEPTTKLLWAYDLGSGFGVAGNLNFSVVDGDPQRYLEIASSEAVSFQITETVGTYVEYFGFYPESKISNSGDEHFLNGGFTFALCDDLQLDVRSGFGLNDDSDDFFTGLGVSARYRGMQKVFPD